MNIKRLSFFLLLFLVLVISLFSEKTKISITVECDTNLIPKVYLDNKPFSCEDPKNFSFYLPINNKIYILKLVFPYEDLTGKKQKISEHAITTSDGKDLHIGIHYGDISVPPNGIIKLNYRQLPDILEDLSLLSGKYKIQIILNDYAWNRKYTIYDKKVFFGEAETFIIDSDEFKYKKKIGLCFIPGAAQFHNYDPLRGTILMSLAAVSLLEGVVVGYLALDHYNNYLQETNNPNFPDYQNTQNILNIAAISGIIIFGITYIYSCIDGITTTNHLYDLFYKNYI